MVRNNSWSAPIIWCEEIIFWKNNMPSKNGHIDKIEEGREPVRAFYLLSIIYNKHLVCGWRSWRVRKKKQNKTKPYATSGVSSELLTAVRGEFEVRDYGRGNQLVPDKAHYLLTPHRQIKHIQ